MRTTRRCLAIMGALLFGAGLAQAELVARGTKSQRTLDIDALGFNSLPGEFRIDLVDPGPNDQLLPYEINGHWGLLNSSGDAVTRPIFDWAEAEFDSLNRVVLAGKTGFVTGNGRWQIEPLPLTIDRFAEQRAIVSNQGQIRFIDRRAVPIGDARYDQALRFKEKLAAVVVNRRAGYITRDGGWAITPRYAEARSFHEGMASVRLYSPDHQPGPYALINRVGEVLETMPPEVTFLGDFEEGLFRVRVQPQGQPETAARWGYLNRRLDWVIPPRLEGARDLTNGLAAVKHEGKWGYVDRTGRVIIKPGYEEADDFDDTVALVRNERGWGMIEQTGRPMSPFVFEEMEAARFGLVRAELDEVGLAYLQVSGRLLWNPRGLAQGLKNRTRRETALVQADDDLAGQRIWPAPKQNPRANALAQPPYPPDHQYDEGLVAWREPAD